MNPLSLKVYDREVRPTLTKRQSEVLAALRVMSRGTCYEVADFMGVKANTISGRFGELEKLKRIKGTVVGRFTVWEPVEPKPLERPVYQQKLFNQFSYEN